MNGCTRIVAFAASVLVAATPAWGQQSKGSPEDEAAIRHVLEVLQEALDRHDAKRLAALFSQDAEYVDPYRILSGQPEIEQFHASVVSRRGRLTWVVERTALSLRFTRPNRAIVNTTFTMREARKRAGPMKWRTTTVLVKQGDRWLIVYHSQGVLEPDAGLTILLNDGSAVEARTAQQLLGLLQTYDVSKWLFTRKVQIQERVIPHSYPVLTLNARRRDTDLEVLKLLSTFVHEQIHRSLSDWPERLKLVEPAMSEFQTLFPAPPIEPPEGTGSGSSTYGHLIVCHLEYEAMKELVGDDKARQVMASFGHYKWVYRTIVTESTKVRAVIQKFNLDAYPQPPTVDRPKVEITSPAGDNLLDQGEPVLLRAKASASTGARVLRVEFLIDDMPVGIDTEPPYESKWPEARKGRHVVTSRVHDSTGKFQLSAPVIVFVGIRALERSVARSEDDAEEYGEGLIYLDSSDLELVNDGWRGDQVVGMRIASIRIPKGTQIKKAYLQFTASLRLTADVQTDLTIHAELAGDAEAFTETHRNISSRKRTSASVKWSPEPWNVDGERSEKQRTPSLSSLIQEVVAQPDWQEGNAVAFIITGSGKRIAESYDRYNKDGAPTLYIEY